MKLSKLFEQVLSEESIDSINIDDFDIDGITTNWLMSSPENTVYEYQYEMEHDYYLSAEEKEYIVNADIDEIAETDRFKKWLRFYAENKIDDSIREISNLIDNGYIEIWREMTVRSDWLKKLATSGKRLGKYWSWDEKSAHAHWGGVGMYRILLETKIREEYIDWTETIERNIDPAIGEDEKEITLFKNTPIKINALEVNGEQVDITRIKDKVFKA